jgi:hypothetical protein
MCLEILVQIHEDAPRRIGAKRLAGICGLVIRSAKLDGQAALHLSVTGGCSCEFLAESASFDEATWDLEPAHRSKLETAARALSSEAKKFRLLLHWLGGERARVETRVSAKELLRLMQANAVGNNVLYHVGHGT